MFYPKQDPRFLYPRSRNPYARLLEALLQQDPERLGLDAGPEQEKGRWQERAQRKPICLEIGCNAGHVLLGRAAQFPERYYLGIDWKHKAVYRAVVKAQQRGLVNVCCLRVDAERLPFLFGEGELDEILIYFPDPWPKRAQASHRFFRPERWKSFHFFLKPGGLLDFKTDQESYFDWVLAGFEAVRRDWEVLDCQRHLHASQPHPELLRVPEVTVFEQLFIRKKLPIFRLQVRRR